MELRTRESVPSMFLFSLSTFVLFRFGLDRETLSGDLASGVLWVTLLFAAVLGMNRLFVAEREEGGFDAFLLAPVDRTSLFVAKAAVLFGFLVAVEIAAIPAFAVLLLGPSPFQALPGLLAILAARRRGHRDHRHAGRRAGDPDPRARPDRAADRAPADAAGGDRRRARDRRRCSPQAGAEALPARWLGGPRPL